jgi:hypothetical protein
MKKCFPKGPVSLPLPTDNLLMGPSVHAVIFVTISWKPLSHFSHVWTAHNVLCSLSTHIITQAMHFRMICCPFNID